MSAKGGEIKVENLLEGDVTADGVVKDTFGMGPNVLVNFEDGTNKQYLRGEIVHVD